MCYNINRFVFFSNFKFVFELMAESLSVCTTIFKRIAGLCFYPKSLMLYINGFVSTSSFQISESFFELNTFFLNNSGVGVMHARWGRHLCSTRSSFTCNFPFMFCNLPFKERIQEQVTFHSFLYLFFLIFTETQCIFFPLIFAALTLFAGVYGFPLAEDTAIGAQEQEALVSMPLCHYRSTREAKILAEPADKLLEDGKVQCSSASDYCFSYWTYENRSGEAEPSLRWLAQGESLDFFP